jgi:Flp pilus assembly protein TadG
MQPPNRAAHGAATRTLPCGTEMRTMSNRSRNGGQALVEFALVLPIFMLVFFGLIDLGRAVYTYNTVANAARSAARVAIVNQSTSGTSTCDTSLSTVWVTGCAESMAVNLGVTSSQVSVTYVDSSNNSCSPVAIGCIAVVSVTADFTPITPIVSQFLGTIPITSTSKEPIERACSNPPPAPLTQC